MIETVKGPIQPDQLGVTMCHEHLAVDLGRIRGDQDATFGRADHALLVEELEKLKKLGCNSVVEVSCCDMGRDVQQLLRLSEDTGLQIVAATGFYLKEYHPQWVIDGEIAEIEAVMYQDLTEGIDGTHIKAGVIGEVASSGDAIYPSEHKVLTAAAHVAEKVGCAVTTHCQLAKLAMEQSALLQNAGMDPDKVILGHLDLANDRAYYREVLATGVNIGFDTIGKTAYLSDEARADQLAYLLDAGYAEHIILSQDISRKSYMSHFGKAAGYTAVLGKFIPMLQARGVTDDLLDQLLRRNPARILNRREETV